MKDNLILEQRDLSVGDKVTYIAPYREPEKGIVKSLPLDTPDAARVVYHCDDTCEDYIDYTAALTYLHHLKKGW